MVVLAVFRRSLVVVIRAKKGWDNGHRTDSTEGGYDSDFIHSAWHTEED